MLQQLDFTLSPRCSLPTPLSSGLLPLQTFFVLQSEALPGRFLRAYLSCSRLQTYTRHCVGMVEWLVAMWTGRRTSLSLTHLCVLHDDEIIARATICDEDSRLHKQPTVSTLGTLRLASRGPRRKV